MKSTSDLSSLLEKRFVNIIGAKPAQAPVVNFDTQDVYLIAMGLQPTTGYTVVVTGETAELDGDTLILPVELKQPDEKLVQAQVMTSPCVVLSLPKANYKRVLAGDLRL